MNVRFAEPCRDDPLALMDAEDRIRLLSIDDGRAEEDKVPGSRPNIFKCQKDIYIGVFFDGTNNNKYRDTPGFSHSNVARLYEVYPGTPAAQTAPKFKMLDENGKKVDRTDLFPDQLFRASSVAPEDFPYYRKVYIPGVGTPMPDVGDSGAGMDKTGGLAAAKFGQVRLDWAMLQLLNQVHAAIFKIPLEPSVDIAALNRQTELAPKVLLYTYENRLKAIVKQRGENLPHMRKIRLSVFGFSRGATAARAWVNMVTQRFGMDLAGIPLQIDFLGIFDTVASVGLAQSMPNFEGHASWATSDNMIVPPTVKRCAHLVAAHEVRGSFPLDSVCQNNMLPANCKEIVYPGVHSDVGGGYPPGDQGRALGDDLKLSQISLAQMYREARMAGVPLAPESAMVGKRKENFTIDPQLRNDFNAYVQATRSGKVPPTNGKGESSFARLFPTETQPREELHLVMRRHYAIVLRWRKDMLKRPGGIAGVEGLKTSTRVTRFQDIEDFRGAEEELGKEIKFLDSTDSNKFDNVDDPTMDVVSNKVTRTIVAGLHAVWGTKSVHDVMREKQTQWDTWLESEWHLTDSDALPAAAKTLFEKYVHDSRAWFKPSFQTGVLALAPDDDDWFDFGEREKEKTKRISQLERKIAGYESEKKTPANDKALAQAREELRVLQQDGQPLILGAREPYRMWGYVRHRRLFYAGNLNAASNATRQHAIEEHEAESARQVRREELIAQENARYEKEDKKIIAQADEAMKSGRIKEADRDAYRRGVSSQRATEKRQHNEALARIEQLTAAPASVK